MSAPRTISVNPCQKTLGEFNYSHEAMAKVSRRLTSTGTKDEFSYKRLVNFLLGLDSHTNMRFSLRILVLRLIFAFVLSIMASNGIEPLMFSIIAVSIALGFCTRIISLAGTIALISAFYTGIMNGDTSIITIATTLFTALFCYFGPGRISLDIIIRKDLFKSMVKGNKREIEVVKEMDYKAFLNLESRLKS